MVALLGSWRRFKLSARIVFSSAIWRVKIHHIKVSTTHVGYGVKQSSSKVDLILSTESRSDRALAVLISLLRLTSRCSVSLAFFSYIPAPFEGSAWCLSPFLRKSTNYSPQWPNNTELQFAILTLHLACKIPCTVENMTAIRYGLCRI